MNISLAHVGEETLLVECTLFTENSSVIDILRATLTFSETMQR